MTGTADDVKIVKVGVANLGLRIGNAVVIDGGHGALVLVGGSFASEIGANVRLNVPNVQFTGAFTVLIQKTGATPIDETLAIGTEMFHIHADANITSRVRVEGNDVTLAVLGQTLGGNFAFEQVTIAGATRTTIAASHVHLGLGDGTTNFVEVTNGQGAFLVQPTGLAGQLSATVQVNGIPGVVFTGPFRIQINNTTAAVDQTFNVGGPMIRLKLPAGPYLRVDGGQTRDDMGNLVGQKVMLSVLGQQIEGNFSFEQTQTASGRKIVSVAASEVSLKLRSSDDTSSDSNIIFRVDNGTGALLMTPQGLAATISADFALGPQFSGTLTISARVTLQLNKLTVPVNETFTAGGQSIPMNLPAGPYLRIAAENVDVSLGGIGLHGNFYFDQYTRAGTMTKVTRLAMTNVNFSGQDDSGSPASIGDGQGALVILPGMGVAGVISGHVMLSTGPVGASADAGVRFNTTGVQVNETIDVGGHPLVVNIGPLSPMKQYQFFLKNITVQFGDVFEVHGDVTQVTGGFAGTNLELFLGKGPYRLPGGGINPDAIGILLTNGTVGVINPPGGGVQLVAMGDLALVGLDGLNVSGTVVIRLNTSNQAVNQTLMVETDDGAVPVVLNFPTGQQIVSFRGDDVRFTVGSVLQIRGGIAFNKQPNGTIDVSLAGASVSINIGAPANPNDPFASPSVYLGGTAAFTIGGTDGFRLQSFKVNGFSLFGVGADVPSPALAGALPDRLPGQAVQRPGARPQRLQRHPHDRRRLHRPERRRPERDVDPRRHRRVRADAQRPAGAGPRPERPADEGARPDQHLPLQLHRPPPAGRRRGDPVPAAVVLRQQRQRQRHQDRGLRPGQPHRAGRPAAARADRPVDRPERRQRPGCLRAERPPLH